MSNLYESIPPDRRQDLLQHAKAAFDEATQPSLDRVIRDMGELVVSGAENAFRDHVANTESLIAEAETSASDSSTYGAEIGDEVESYLGDVQDHGAAIVEAEHIANRITDGSSLTPSQEAFIAAAATGTPYNLDDQGNTPRNLEEEFAKRYLTTE